MCGTIFFALSLSICKGAVGKTSLVLRYVEDTFNSNHITTLQVIDNCFVTVLQTFGCEAIQQLKYGNAINIINLFV